MDAVSVTQSFIRQAPVACCALLLLLYTVQYKITYFKFLPVLLQNHNLGNKVGVDQPVTATLGTCFLFSCVYIGGSGFGLNLFTPLLVRGRLFDCFLRIIKKA